MDAVSRRMHYGRTPGVAGLLILAVLFLVLTSPVRGENSLSRHQRREDAPSLVWRQEPPPTKPTASANATESSRSSMSSSTSNVSSTRTTSGPSVSSTVPFFSRPTSSTSGNSVTTASESSTSRSVSTAVSSSSKSSKISALTFTVTQTRPSDTTSAHSVSPTTLIVPAVIQAAPSSTTMVVSTPSDPLPTSALESVRSSPKGFWANKGAVAATFVMLSLFILGIAAIVLLNFFRRKKAARQRHLHPEFFDKYSDTTSPNNSIHGAASQKGDVVYDDSRFQGATVTSAYPFSGSGFAVASSSPPVPQEQYQYPVPPGSSDSQASHQTAFYTPDGSQHSLTTQQHPIASGVSSGLAAPQRTQYALPYHAQAAMAVNYVPDNVSAAPVAYREPSRARRSYQRSIDSFYGYYSNANAAGTQNP